MQKLKLLFSILIFFVFLVSSNTQASAQCFVDNADRCDVCGDHEVCTDIGALDGGYHCTVLIGVCGATLDNTCNSSTVNQCSVCSQPNELCVLKDGEYQCENVVGQCGVEQNDTCNETTVDTCDVCENHQTCTAHTDDQGAKSYSCDTVSGSCGATSQNSCFVGTLNSCDVCPVGQRCKQNGSGPNDQACLPDSTCLDRPEFVLCRQAGPEGSASRAKCDTCSAQKGVWTGVGCIPFSDTAELVRAFITLGLGLAGTVVVLMTLAGAFLMSTSKGEPQKVDEAKSLITSAIAGIFFIIFSVSILQFVGVRILQLPGFG